MSSPRRADLLLAALLLSTGCAAPADRAPPRAEAPTLSAAAPPIPESPAPPIEAEAEAPRVPEPPAVDLDRPALSPALHRLRRSAQERVLGRLSPPGPHAFAYAPPGGAPPDPASVTGSTAEPSPEEAPSADRARDKPRPPPALGRFVPIEPESALDGFHAALRQLAAGKDPSKKTRILAYGASHTQADIYTGYLRAYLQARFGDGGQGFVLFGQVNRWYRTLDTRVQHHALSVHLARYQDTSQDEPLGLFGAALIGRGGGGYAEIVTAKSSRSTQFEVHYHEEPGGGDFELVVDGQVVARIKTAAGSAGPAYHRFEQGPGRHEIRARLVGNGPVRLFGVTAETAGAGVVVDTLGISGARMESFLRWREDAWIDAVRRRDPDLVTFAYGTNEATGASPSIASYEQRIRAVVARLRRAAPRASCVLLGPFDFPARREGRWVSRPRLLTLVAAQRRIAAEVGCGFWDGRAFMGGEGSMARWAAAEPPLAADDHIHLTRRGYAYAGIALGDALMRRYDAP